MMKHTSRVAAGRDGRGCKNLHACYWETRHGAGETLVPLQRCPKVEHDAFFLLKSKCLCDILAAVPWSFILTILKPC